MLDPSWFASLDGCWGPHTIERFTSVKTKQLDRFCSRFLNPGCEAVDAFTVSWAGDYNWLFPPPYLVPCVLCHMNDGREDRILLVPEWPSASWWPLLFAKHGSWHAEFGQSCSVSSVNAAVYGVSWVHKKSGYPEPSEYPM
ncbi:unnamed protein product, partial [Porites evermanni]